MATLHPNQMQRRSTELAYKQYKLLSAVCCLLSSRESSQTHNPESKTQAQTRHQNHSQPQNSGPHPLPLSFA